jgi:hypothetical protein
MIDKIIFILLTILLVGASIYYVYEAWFDSENLRATLIKRQKQLPTWYPLRGYALQRLQQNNWLWEIRLLSIVLLIATITVVGIAILKPGFSL